MTKKYTIIYNNDQGYEDYESYPSGLVFDSKREAEEYLDNKNYDYDPYERQWVNYNENDHRIARVDYLTLVNPNDVIRFIEDNEPDPENWLHRGADIYNIGNELYAHTFYLEAGEKVYYELVPQYKTVQGFELTEWELAD